ncbi:UDP-4-amino-4,6-dideoxy-N-acetyl-beta-L-altrosamine transaminase [Roseobacter litoralis]|uniref:UDP-4-amino-4, 6-dideoxy-N-acetyl-beta-L-altrosamine transaminase n=1 Tax=Roseobacter litoralis TaxID=42443 RepID=UPI002494F2CC|nr:UDP-4-amino-4,6-dideoxy-N-acetyl-beta-L-altrosamine transaminase [Roseobacter litoralis]
MIPYGRQDISQPDIDAVVEVLKSDFLTQGPVVPRFEAAIAKKVDASFGVAVNSATSALHIAASALGLGPGDLLWTSPITFVASANSARYCGADVDFVDIDPDTYNMCPTALEKKLDQAEKNGRLPKILMPVHMCGQSCSMKEISELARSRGIRVIEDASHAIGGQYHGKPIGCCAYSDITVFSFHPVKIVTTAEGGMAITNDGALYKRMCLLRSHGVTRDPDIMESEPHGPWYYEQLELGWNYRMTELQAALGLSQLTRLDDFVERRTRLADRYDQLLQGQPLLLPTRQSDSQSSHHLYVVRLKDGNHLARRDAFDRLRADGIGVNVHYIPVHLQPYYENLGFQRGDFPHSESYYEQALSLPLFAGMTDDQQEKVVHSIGQALA